MEPVKIITAQHAARAHELHEKFDALHTEVSSLQDWVWSKLCVPSEKTAQVATFAAKAHASAKTSAIGKEIATGRVMLRSAKHDMTLVHLQAKIADLQAKVSELQAWDIMAPLLDSCPE